MLPHRHSRTLLLYALSLSFVACDDACTSDIITLEDAAIPDMAAPDMEVDQPSLAPVDRVEIDPSDATIEEGSTLQLTGNLYDAENNLLSGRETEWRIVPAAVAEVSDDGLVTALAPGIARIRLFSEGVSGEMDLTVVERTVASVAIEPANASVKVRRNIQLSAKALASDGTELTKLFTWTSSDPLVATVNSSGLVTGGMVGQATITAAADGVEGTTSVTVDALDVESITITSGAITIGEGQSTQAEALARDEDQTPIAGRMFDWSTGDPNVATVTPTGVVTGVNAGLTTLTAEIDGVSDTVSLQVTATPVAALQIDPASLTIGEGAQQTLTARTFDSGGNELMGRTVTWTSNDMNIVTVDPNSGLVTAQRQGVADVIATSESAMRTCVVTVLAGVDRVDVTPGSANVTEGDSATFTATAFDSMNNPLTNRTITWDVTDPTIATVTPLGEVTTLKEGTTTVRATSEGVSGTATLTVDPKPVDSVLVMPNVSVLLPTQTTTLTAQPFDVDGNALTGRTVMWSSDAPGIASVDASGEVTAVGQGRAEITANIEGKIGVAEIVVAVKFERIESAGVSTCGTDVLGNDYCWGRDVFGVLGNGSMSSSNQTTADLVDANLTFESFSGRSLHVCGLTDSNDLYCWGSNDSGQLGNGKTIVTNVCSQTNRCDSPALVTTGETFESVSAGGSHTCALNTAQAAFCWGNSSSGQIGYDPAAPPVDTNVPRAVTGGLTFSAIAAGGEHTCAITAADGTAYCWGSNNEGQLGTLTSGNKNVPTPVDTSDKFAAIAAGPSHTCGVTVGGDVVCWGCNGDGQLGAGFIGTNGAMSDGQLCDALRTPQTVTSAETFTSVTLGSSHTCALTTGGTAYCWGANDANQRGDGSGNTFSLGSPQAVSGSITFTSVDAGSAHTCGISDQEIAYCWGEPFGGRLGDGVSNHVDFGARLSSPFPVVVQ